MTVVLIPVISSYGVTAIPVLGLMAATILLLMATLRLGKYIKNVPGPVVEGFTVGNRTTYYVAAISLCAGAFQKGSGDRTVTSAFNTVAGCHQCRFKMANNLCRSDDACYQV